MQPYVVKQGDHLPLLAYRFAFDADSVWNDPANDDLRKLRPDPNLLLPTDVLYIPDQVNKKPVVHSLQTGQNNLFVSDVPNVSLVVAFADPARASQAFTVTECLDRHSHLDAEDLDRLYQRRRDLQRQRRTPEPDRDPERRGPTASEPRLSGPGHGTSTAWTSTRCGPRSRRCRPASRTGKPAR